MSATHSDGDVALDSAALDQLSNAEAKNLLDTIDNLRQLKVGRIVNLPQIIVVGAQSSGKSSVLEAISRVRFPTDGRVCTRFATELILRREPRTSVDVSIQFANGPEEKVAPFQTSGFSKDDLPELIKQAKERMGIRTGGKEFSDDVLRVEITGPNMYHLTLVDLPGLYQGSTAEQSERGAVFVNQLIKRYMSQSNSIILAVVSASYNLANQMILDATKKHDPNRERTLGVITKPDLAGVADERHFIQLAKNQEAAHKLTLGWHVLRNRAEKEEEQKMDCEERDAQEARFFQTGPWSSIPTPSRGVESLRKKLSNVLLFHIQKTLPAVIGDIEENLKTRSDELDRLGKSRCTPEEMRSYLLDIARDFERLAQDAIDGRYSDAFFGGLNNGERKLRALLRNLNRAFDVTLSTKGAKYELKPGAELETSGKSIHDEDDAATPSYLRPFLSEYNFPDPKPMLETEMMEDLERWASANQGKEFPGSPNNDLAIQLFKEQAQSWEKIAHFHVLKVLEVTKVVVEQLFVHIVGPNPRTTQALLRNYVDAFFEAKADELSAKLKELLRPYASGYGLPLETEFYQRVRKISLDQLAKHFADSLDDEYLKAFGESPNKRLSKHDILRALSTSTGRMADSKFGTDGMSLGIFTDNVINLAIESALVCDIPKILTTPEVGRMSNDTLEELASEAEEIRAERQMLEEQVNILRAGLRECKQHRPRDITVPSSSLFGLSVPAAEGARSSSAPPSSRTSTPAVPAPATVPAAVSAAGPTQSPQLVPPTSRSTNAAQPPSVFATQSLFDKPAFGSGFFGSGGSLFQTSPSPAFASSLSSTGSFSFGPPATAVSRPANTTSPAGPAAGASSFGSTSGPPQTSSGGLFGNPPSPFGKAPVAGTSAFGTSQGSGASGSKS